MESRCPACNSDRVVEGAIGITSEWCGFQLPSQESGLLRAAGPSVEIEREGHLCVESGFVWTRSDKDAVREAIARGGKDELLAKLRIPAARKRHWWSWLFRGIR